MVIRNFCVIFFALDVYINAVPFFSNLGKWYGINIDVLNIETIFICGM